MQLMPDVTQRRTTVPKPADTIDVQLRSTTLTFMLAKGTTLSSTAQQLWVEGNPRAMQALTTPPQKYTFYPT